MATKAKKKTSKTTRNNTTSSPSKSDKPTNPNPFIIGVPLIIVAVFSFSFISMYPNKANAPVAKVNNKPSGQNSASTLPPIAITAASLQKLTPLSEATPTESQPASPSGGVKATSQNPQESSDDTVAAGTDEIQSAAQTKNLYNLKITVPKTPAAQTR